MALTRLAVENYRCFARRQELELRPITVVLGKNNSGKSALVRAPWVISTGFTTDAAIPLDLDQLGEDAPEFVDLVHNRFDHGSITVDLELDGRELVTAKLSTTIQNLTEAYTQLVSRWEMTNSVGERLRYTWLPEDEPNDEIPQVWSYHREAGGDQAARSTPDFRGLLPAADPMDTEVLRRWFGEVRRLGPFRTPLGRVTRPPNRMPRQDEFGGETARILVFDKRRNGGALTNKINEYLSDYLPWWELEVIPRYDGYAIGLKSVRTQDLWVSSSDAGTGLTQVLPLLLQRAQDELAPPDHDVLEIIEEPELHLHPPGQAGLADLYIRAVGLVPQTRFLIETHSELLLLRLRRRVAEGALRPEDLALYYVDHDGTSSIARRINVDELGDVDYWPEGVFSEDFDEVRKLTDAQDRREADAR